MAKSNPTPASAPLVSNEAILFSGTEGIFECHGPRKDECSILVPAGNGVNKRVYTTLDKVERKLVANGTVKA